MSEDVYVLTHKASVEQLDNLNKTEFWDEPEDYDDSNLISNLYSTIECDVTPYGMSQVCDWIAALKSGKKIVNPMSPREELKQYYDGMCFSVESRSGNPFYPKQLIECVVEIIAKEHPDVSGWLKDGDSNA